MPNLWDKLPDAPPAAELNPLTNPLLERNLRRWANVYFGNPPARREQAVSKLIEELKREAGAPASEASPSARVRDARFLGVVCSACQHQNPQGHRFCSRCGETLDPAPLLPTENLSGPPAGPRSARPVSDVQWMPEQRFSSLDKFDTPPRRGWKYLAAAAMIVMAGAAYMQWFSGTKTKMTSTVSTAAPQASEPVSPALNNSSSADTGRPPETISPPARKVEAQNQSVTAPLQDQTAAPGMLQPAVQRSPLPDAEKSHPAAPIEESGASDLRLAQRYLEGGMGARDSTEAAKLLWKAVKKQNAAAEVLLSDLYLRGDGVPQSCDQARLLLLAAAKRGSAQGARQLRDLESRGCR